jgi:hypothetical protein
MGIGHIISAEMLSAYAKNSDIDSKLSSVNTKSSVSVDNVQSNLNVIHIDNSEYSNLVANDSVDNSTIYIVSSENFDVFGEQIKNLAPGTDLSDAVNLEQLNSVETSINSNV